jgi:hypothetical protein
LRGRRTKLPRQSTLRLESGWVNARRRCPRWQCCCLLAGSPSAVTSVNVP